MERGEGGAHFFHANNYDLAATLTSGQAFRWCPTPDAAWEGIIGQDHPILRQQPNGIQAQASTPNPNWPAVQRYLQTDTDIDAITDTFPNDPPMQAAIQACRGLRLLRQDAWETLASFILSSTKQIVQIQQIVSAVCSCYGDPIDVSQFQISSFKSQIPYSFPTAERIAALT